MPIAPRIILGLTATSLLGVGWALQPDQDKSQEIAVHPVAGSVSMLEGQGGNIGVCAGPDGLLMIDDQFAPMAPKIQAALAELSKEPLRFLVNTHCHGDHTGGNEFFGALVPIVAQTKVRERMSKSASGRGGDQPPAPLRALPVLTFDDRVTFHFNGEEIEVRHVSPAHTDGDSIIWFHKSNVVHMGDTFFNGRFPFVDLDSGGSLKGLTQDIGALLEELPKDVHLIPGHGAQGTLQDLVHYHAMLIETQKLVAAALAAGKDAKAMKAEKILAKYESWSWQFINADSFIDILVRDATGK